jgi:hypothetical protein
MRKLLTCITTVALLIMVACSPIENKARDTAAALGGSLAAAQAKYHDSCVATPSQKVCVLINNGIAGENALITSVETYCGWSTLAPPTDMSAKCVPVKSAEGALITAIANATQLTLEIKGAI